MINADGLQQLHDELFAITWDTHDLVRTTCTPICHRYGITLQQMHVLNELRRMPGTTVGALSDKSGILRTNFAAVCRKLEDKGLITRESKDGDKRAYVLFLSDKGVALLMNIENEILIDIQNRSESVSPEMLQQALDGLKALRRLIQSLER